MGLSGELAVHSPQSTAFVGGRGGGGLGASVATKLNCFVFYTFLYKNAPPCVPLDLRPFDFDFDFDLIFFLLLRRR